MLQKIGLLMVLLGISCGDSPVLWVPVLIMAAGAGLYWIGTKKEPERRQARRARG